MPAQRLAMRTKFNGPSVDDLRARMRLGYWL